MKFEFFDECLIFRPKEIKTFNDLESLNALLDGMAHRSGFEYFGIDKEQLSFLQKNEWIVAEVNETSNKSAFRYFGYKRRSDIDQTFV